MPDFEVGIEMTVLKHFDHLPKPVDPETRRSGIAALIVKPNDEAIVLVLSLNQRNLWQRGVRNIRLNDRIIQRNVEQIVIALCGRPRELRVASQNSDEVFCQPLRAGDANVQAGRRKADYLQISLPVDCILFIGPPAFGIKL